MPARISNIMARPWFGTALPLAVGALITLLAWPITLRPAIATLDESWQIALHLAAARQLQHGVDMVFTYGPLGFLGFPIPYVGVTSTLALIAAGVVYLALITTLFIEARRVLPSWSAGLVTLLVARAFVLLPPFEAFQALILIWSIEILGGTARPRGAILPIVAGAVAGLAIFGKANIGAGVAAMALVTTFAVTSDRRRSAVVFGLTMLVATIAGWVILGQEVANLPTFARGVAEIVSGYNGAMGADLMPKRAWVYTALVGSGLFAASALWLHGRRWPRQQAAGLALLVLVIGFALWKTALVREHTTFVLATLMIAIFPLASTLGRSIFLMGILGVGMALAGASAIEPRMYLDVPTSVRSLTLEAADALVPGRSDRAVAQTRERLRSRYALEPATLEALRGHTVQVDPDLTSVVFAYPEVGWAPLPSFQAYSTYTPVLDRQDADRLRSDRGPERILRSFRPATPTDLFRTWIDRPLRADEVLPFTVDGRFRWFEQPETTLEMFCRYREVSATDRWEVLARSDRSCGPPEALATVNARAGDTVTVPTEVRPDRFVILKVHGLEPSILGRIRAALLKAYDWWVRVDGTRYRLVAATAADGLLVAVPPAADGTGRFAFGPPIRTISITRDLDDRGSTAPLTFEFLSVPLATP
jgi:hypothetical protein